jgi:hypothetical protein
MVGLKVQLSHIPNAVGPATTDGAAVIISPAARRLYGPMATTYDGFRKGATSGRVCGPDAVPP